MHHHFFGLGCLLEKTAVSVTKWFSNVISLLQVMDVTVDLFDFRREELRQQREIEMMQKSFRVYTQLSIILYCMWY
jgi:hypothetical protein